MDVSRNSDTPKSSILIGFSIINHPLETPIYWEVPGGQWICRFCLNGLKDNLGCLGSLLLWWCCWLRFRSIGAAWRKLSSQVSWIILVVVFLVALWCLECEKQEGIQWWASASRSSSSGSSSRRDVVVRLQNFQAAKEAGTRHLKR